MNKQRFQVWGQLEDGKDIDVICNSWRELQRVLTDIRKDGSITETKVSIAILA